MKKLGAILVAALSFIAMFFKAKSDRVQRELAEDRAESAERGLENAKTAKDNRNLVESSSRRIVDRLRDQFTRKN